MKNILVISWHFAPRNTIGAIRFTKMVKYLARTGEYHFWVICSSLNEGDIKDELLQRDMDGAAQYVTILPVSLNRMHLAETLKRHAGKMFCKSQESNDTNRATLSAVNNIVLSKEKSITGRLKKFFGKTLIAINDIYIFVCDDIAFAQKGVKLSKKLPMDKMNAMLTTWGPTGSLLLGLKYKKRNKNLKWIVDYRDPCTTSGKLLGLYLRYAAYKADKSASYITGAGRTHIGSGKYMKKFHMIRNGFDKEDILGLTHCEHRDKLWITYTGTIYDGKDDIRPLFQILHELELENLISREHISVVYAGNDYHIIQNQAKDCGMENILINKGKLSRKKALELQYQSDILCVLAWNTWNERDVMKGKFIEYFMMKKPIFSIISGNAADSAVKKITQRAKLGYALEEAGGSKGHAEAKQWILSKYQEFMMNGCLKCHSDETFLNRYSSAVMAKRFKELIDA
ncbi:MAG: hypothetical protein K2N73_17545 [Lachnospiraceae bacterium]|nr:hypothetical protein [Lachnospiraceae bacterium]